MPTLRHRRLREDVSARSSGDRRPVMLATLDVPFAADAIAFAVDSAVENGNPLVVVNAAEVLLTPGALVGYGYVEREELQNELRRPAELARSLAVPVERVRVCSPHPVDALIELVSERRPALLVFGPERSRISRRRYRKAATAVSTRAPCLVWLP